MVLMEIDLDKKKALEEYATFSFDSNEAFQEGLASILAGSATGSTSQADLKADTILRAKIFYFNKTTGNNLSLEDVNATVSNPDATLEDETRILTLAELKELIETGKTDKIPNNKIIAEKLSTDQPSQSTMQPRKKPWEFNEDKTS